MELKKIKLNKLSGDALAQRQMKGLKGGSIYRRSCTCSCAYANTGGSSTEDNLTANYRLGPKGGYCNYNIPIDKLRGLYDGILQQNVLIPRRAL